MKRFTTKTTMALVLVIALLMSAFSTTVFAANDPLVDESEPVSLTIHKYDVPDGGTGAYDLIGNSNDVASTELDVPPTYEPLAEVTFAAYLIEDNAAGRAFEDLYKNKTDIPDSDIYTPVGTVITDATGTATFEDDQNGGDIDQGRYLIVETKSPDKVTAKSMNFVVDLPYTNVDQETWNYNVHVYPKNYTMLGTVVLTKTIEGETITAGLSATFDLEMKQPDDTYAVIKSDLVTDAAGKITVPNLLKGDYRFVETVAPTGYGKVDAKYFSITKDASVEVVQVTIDNSKEPVINKTVSKDGVTFGPAANVDADAPATWKISPVVPTDIATYAKYVVTDQIDSRLILNQASIKVMADAAQLVDGVDYQLEVTADDLITITFISDTFDGGKTALDGVTELSITYTTTIDITDTTVLGVNIPNQAHLTFDNSFDVEKTVDSDEPVVYTGGKKFVKVDSTNSDIHLAGAEFVVYATEADAENGVNPIVTGLVSAADGTFEVVGLAYGDYWLVETKAPAEYHLNDSPISFTVNATSYDDDDSTTYDFMEIKNVEKPDLPITGGQGTLMFTIIGLALVGLATVLFARYRKSRKTTV